MLLYVGDSPASGALPYPELHLIENILASAEGPACASCSFQAGGVVVLDLIRRVEPRIPVLFIDTGYHFPETLAFRDRLAAEWNLNLINLRAEETVAEQEEREGLLYVSDPSRCCRLRKVEPLFRELEKYAVWFTGLRRRQSPSRMGIQTVEAAVLPSGRVLTKVNPLADWSSDRLWSYLAEHGIPSLPLYEEGFTSIGCAPCTTIPFDPANPRSGRWGGRKLECGIHSYAGGD